MIDEITFPPPPRFTANPENQMAIEALADALGELPIGAIASYYQLASAAPGRAIQGRDRHLLVSAVECAEKDCGAVFSTVRDVGIKRLAAEDAVEIGRSALASIRRRGERAAGRIDRISTNGLPEEAAKRRIAYSAMLRTIAAMADGRSVAAAVRGTEVTALPNAMTILGALRR